MSAHSDNDGFWVVLALQSNPFCHSLGSTQSRIESGICIGQLSQHDRMKIASVMPFLKLLS